jgi:hypothetical protein
MPLYTCPRCHNTFPSTDKPSACPECGHQWPIPASEVEFNNYYSTRLASIRESCAPGMTMDERNWTRILLFLNKPMVSFYTSHLLRHYVLEATPEMCLDTYKGFRWEYTRMVKQDRIALQLEGFKESRLLMRREDGTPLVKGWDHYGAALRLLYSFETTDPHKAPNLGNITHIDLERIAAEPSAAYTQFLWNWLEAVKDVPSPKGFLLSEAKPLLKLMKKDENSIKGL